MIYQLVRKARKLFKTAAYAKHSRNDYYFNRIYFKRMLQFFKTVNVADTNPHLKLTQAQISPLGLKFGSTVSAVKKELGKEKYAYENGNPQDNHRVLFYRRSFSETSLLVQLHFYNNQLYFIGLDVIRRLINKEEKSEIINTVIQKYLKTPYTLGDPYPVIKDEASNIVIINDDINFSICYVPGQMTIDRQKEIVKAMDIEPQEKPDKGSLFYAF